MGCIDTPENNDVPHGREKVITCYGIIGVLSLATSELRPWPLSGLGSSSADFLLIITGRTPSCRLLSHPIYLATDFRLLPLSPLSTSATILDHPVEKELISLVEQGLRSAKLWFSYGWDLTNTLQRQKELEEAGKGVGKLPLWKRASDRFFWNRFLSGKMIDMTENGGVDVSLAILSPYHAMTDVLAEPIHLADSLWV